jgi:inosine-uridine nucleoside N-ribohydrolase
MSDAQQERIPVIIDSDGCEVSCDALWYALTSDAYEVVAVTGELGVTSPEQAARNFCKVLHAAGRSDVPVGVGTAERLGPAPDIPSPASVHGDDGLAGLHPDDAPFGPVAEPAEELIARLCAERPGELAIAALGPFGNVARAVRGSDVATDARQLVIMGGAASPPGNATATGEYNVVFDPVAAHEMMHAPWATPPRMVGLDVTHVATLSDAEFALLEEPRTPAARFMAGPMSAYRPLSAAQTPDKTCPSHDTLALLSLAYPQLFTWEELPVTVDTAGGAAWGTTVVDLRPLALRDVDLPPELAALAEEVFYADRARWLVALDADVDGFRARIRAFYGGAE